jgi:transposase-like protein
MPRKPNKPTRRRYSDEDRANALAALSANEGNIERTASQLGIPRKTLTNWAKGTNHPEAAELGQQKRPALADAIELVAYQLVESMPGKIPEANLRDVTVSLGIAVDKIRVLRDLPTAITKTEGTVTGEHKHEVDPAAFRSFMDGVLAAGVRPVPADGDGQPVG